MSFKDHFSGHAEGYGAFRPRYGPGVVTYLASLAPPETTVWDAGTGSGQLALALGGRFARVIATDASRAQIDEAPRHPHVEYRVEPAEASSLEDRSVGLITVAQAAHWFDLDRFYAEARRVALPGAAVVLLGYELMSVEPEIDRIIHWFYKGVVGAYWPPERAHLETGYRDLPFPFPVLDAPTLALGHDWDLDRLIGYLGTWSAVAGYRKAHGEDPIPLVRDALDRLWPDPRKPRAVTWPLIVKAGRVGFACGSR